ncbi:molybdate ABC transporter substrate-binding protein [Nocardioides marinquilinus]|uniref:Molybdate ABC transporter substrate-binding protein n=1 Tax=Nocardioides marinquilinus TaxID=1210400 RepID=A0ABP9P7P8_9ACTN
MYRTLLALPIAVLLSAGLAACGGDDGGGDDGDQTVTVYAAASLTKAFEQLKDDFEADHEGVTVDLELGGSSDLVTQLVEGADGDVFASADEANMTKLTDADLQADDPQLFASNTLEIAVPPDNPAGVQSFEDLAGPDVDLVVCAPEVPCGAATQSMAELVGVTLDPVSEADSVTDVIGQVVAGQADAGVVYRTDVIAAGDDVTGVEFPQAQEVVNRYPIVALDDAADPELAQEFVDLVLSEEGQQVLADAGFGAP